MLITLTLFAQQGIASQRKRELKQTIRATNRSTCRCECEEDRDFALYREISSASACEPKKERINDDHHRSTFTNLDAPFFFIALQKLKMVMVMA